MAQKRGKPLVLINGVGVRPKNIGTIEVANPYTTPRTVSIAELRLVLGAYMDGVTWAQDALMDLWRMGAPDPQASLCPFHPPCKELECPHIKRVLLPNQFATWWADVCKRQGLEQVTPQQRVILKVSQ